MNRGRCKACAGPRGKTRKALVIGRGTRVRGLVCLRCANAGTLICVVVVKAKKKTTAAARLTGGRKELGDLFGIELEEAQP